jgi:tRNA(Ile)-lysidine synthase
VGGHQTRPYAEQPWPGHETPFAPCILPLLPVAMPLQVPGDTLLPGWKVTATIMPLGQCDCHSERSQEPHPARGLGPFLTYLDLARTGTELLVRQRRPGDRFQPLGMSMSKKLQDFMVDTRIPRTLRDHIPVVTSPQHIVWVVGCRIDDRVKVTDATGQVLRLEFERLE